MTITTTLNRIRAQTAAWNAALAKMADDFRAVVA